ncbi:MAG: hypothetical protein KF686_03540 [Ramlibacter sp.]|nr:hypothetical protein [Ramlibacter sp.]
MTDAELIAHLGGPAKLSELLNYEKHGGVQRIQNWITRGIPSKVKVDHPHIFLVGLTRHPGEAGQVPESEKQGV